MYSTDIIDAKIEDIDNKETKEAKFDIENDGGVKEMTNEEKKEVSLNDILVAIKTMGEEFAKFYETFTKKETVDNKDSVVETKEPKTEAEVVDADKDKKIEELESQKTELMKQIEDFSKPDKKSKETAKEEFTVKNMKFHEIVAAMASMY